MTSSQSVSFGFGGFTLDPFDQTLFYATKPVKIAGKEFDILSYFVQHPGRLIRAEELAVAVWGAEGNKFTRNLPHHISRIRTIIGCDPRVPKYIQTIYAKKGYRFIAPVHVKEATLAADRAIESQSASDAAFQITCHLFVPMFLGASTYSKAFVKRSNPWTDYKEYETTKGQLHILPNGFGIWHIVESGQFDHLWEFVRWRKGVYEEILSGSHVISIHVRELLRASEEEPVLNSIRGKPSYVFSAQVLRSTSIRNYEIVARVLQLLAIPSVLEYGSPIHEKDDAKDLLERKLLDAKTAEKDLNEFGVAGIDQGFASWDSLSYQVRAGRSLEQTIVDFEIAVQLLWWMAKCVTDVLLKGEMDETERIDLFIPVLKRQFAKIKNISAIETPSQRTMIESVLMASRLKEMVNIAIELHNDLPK